MNRLQRVIQEPKRVIEYFKWKIEHTRDHWQEAGMEKKALRMLSTFTQEQVISDRLRLMALIFDCQVSDVEQYVNELEEDIDFQTHLAHKRDALAERGFKGSADNSDCTTIYVLIRLLKPKIVVETGVQFGASSAHILKAMSHNGWGNLYSIDLPRPDADAFGTPLGLGCLVPEHLRNNWQIQWADSKKALPSLLVNLTEIDLFLHDSVHTYDFMFWEYETAWPYIRQGGWLGSHDIWRHQAFTDFCKKYERELGKFITIYNIGMVKKYFQPDH